MDFCARMTARLLYDEIKKGSKKIQKGSKKNIVVSPLSFNAVLNMVAAGSTGHTFEQMSEFLACKNLDDINSKFSELMSIVTSSSDDDNDGESNPKNGGGGGGGGPIICLANGVWVDKRFPIKASYQKLVNRVFKAHVKNADFANEPDKVVEDANAWAKSATKGLVTNILQPEDVQSSLTGLILANALYFKGSWNKKFDATRNIKRAFYLLNGSEVSVPFMSGGGVGYRYGSYDDFELAEMPYKSEKDGRRFSMFILLPNDRNGLEKLLEKASSDPRFFRQRFQLNPQGVDVLLIPKFKFTYGTSKGVKSMVKMGLRLPFKEDCKELTELIDTKGEELNVSSIIQKAFIEVDEDGTKAAVVTAVGKRVGCSLKRKIYEPTEFVADHPFIFMIREEMSRSVLFTGLVLNPLLQ